MTVTDQIKILDDRLNQIKRSMIWEREAAKVFALSSKNLLDWYEYLTGKDIGYN